MNEDQQANTLVDLVQWIYKKVWDIDKSRTDIKRDIKAGAVQLNGVKLTNPNAIIAVE